MTIRRIRHKIYTHLKRTLGGYIYTKRYGNEIMVGAYRAFTIYDICTITILPTTLENEFYLIICDPPYTVNIHFKYTNNNSFSIID